MELSQRPFASWTSNKLERLAGPGPLALAAIVLASLAFRVHLSNECGLWLDEATTHRGVLQPWPVVLAGPSREHPPLMYVLIRIVIEAFGDSTTALRSVSLFFGCVLLLALHELCLQLRLSSKRALLVVGTFALTPFFIRHATEARHYAILASFVTLAVTRVLRLLQGPVRARDIAAFALCGVAASCTQYFGIPYVVALLGTLGLGMRRIWKQLRLLGRLTLLGSLTGLLGVLAFIGRIAVDRFSPGTALNEAPAVELNEYLFEQLLAQFSFLTSPVWAWSIQPPLSFVGLGLLSWQLRGVSRLLPFGLGLAPCVGALFMPATHFLTPRYFAPSAVLLHLATVVALLTVGDRVRVLLAGRKYPWRAAIPVGGIGIAALICARLREFPDGYSAGGEDYKALQRYYVEHLAKDTRVVAYVGLIGHLLFDREYPLGTPVIRLEKFQPVAGIERYLLVELHTGPRQRALETLVRRNFGISREAWRGLPLVQLPHSRYQSPVKARLIQLPPDVALPAPPRKRTRKR